MVLTTETAQLLALLASRDGSACSIVSAARAAADALPLLQHAKTAAS